MCLRGVSELQKRWLAKDPDAPISVRIVWTPELGADRGDVAAAAALIPDPRVHHYWDGEEVLGRTFAETLVDRPVGPLWDVYFLYRPDATWSGPAPDGLELWMHQLVSLQGRVPHLDPDAFAAAARALYDEATPPPPDRGDDDD